ncbi:MAG: SNF2-related protein [Pseudomonadota bacterium]
MSDFIPGQRWINDAQLQMGLGTVLQTDFRTVTVIFLATGETFVYSKESVPLTRVRFSPGDHIVTLEKENFEVIEVTESEGLIIYQARSEDGAESAIDESCLDFLIQLNRPTERLFHGQVDRDLWFEVRYQTQKYLSDLSRDPLRGLAGGRVSLIPHQLYIANEVARRYAPRVLLADEVGLGKTIEAGMILHHQLVSERAKRVLIVVPDSLVHQWLVEMLRRFNLSFSVFDEQRYRAILSADDDEPELNDAEEVDAEPAEEDRSTIDNPFQTEQLVICSVGTLTSDPDIYKHCRAGEWDMLVVDEAHHLQWSQQEPSLEYALVEKLAEETRSVLLLTATPEQLGRESHFARLRLLDPARFSDFDSFVQEEERYKPIADLVHQLEGQDLVSAEHRSSIEKTLSPISAFWERFGHRL